MIPTIKDLDLGQWKVNPHSSEHKELKINGTHILVGEIIEYPPYQDFRGILRGGIIRVQARLSNIKGHWVELPITATNEEVKDAWEKEMTKLLEKLFK